MYGILSVYKLILFNIIIICSNSYSLRFSHTSIDFGLALDMFILCFFIQGSGWYAMVRNSTSEVAGRISSYACNTVLIIFLMV